jgi:hypothetical protein
MESDEVKKLSADLSNKVDALVAELKKNLLNSPYNSRGLFDKVKNWWNNVTKGSDNTSNPYYFQNKFGSLGRTNPVSTNQQPEKEPEPNPSQPSDDDEFSLGTSKNENKLTLKEYSFLSENFKILDKKISNLILNEQEYASNNLKNLEIFKIIDSWAAHFKKEIINMLTGHESMPAVQKNRQMAREKGELDTDSPPKTTASDSGVEFKTWIRSESNMENFVNLVNKIFESPLYRRPLQTISSSLESRRIKNPKKGEEGTSLAISIRNRIIGIIQKEIENGIDETKSVFSKKVWAWAKKLRVFNKKQKEEETQPEVISAPPAEREPAPEVDLSPESFI